MRWNHRRSVAALALAVAGIATAATPAAAQPAAAEKAAAAVAAPQLVFAPFPLDEPNPPAQLKFRHSGLCLTIPPTSLRVEGTQLVQSPCLSLSNQIWTFQVASSRVEFRLYNASSRMCVNVAGGKYVPGARIIQYRCGQYTNEFFKKTYQINDDYSTTPPGADFWYTPGASSNYAFYVSGGSTASGAKVFLYNRAGVTYEYIRNA